MPKPAPVAAELCEADIFRHPGRSAAPRRSATAPIRRRFRRNPLIIDDCSTSASPPEPPDRPSNRRGDLPRAPVPRLRAADLPKPHPSFRGTNFCNPLVIRICSTISTEREPRRSPRFVPGALAIVSFFPISASPGASVVQSARPSPEARKSAIVQHYPLSKMASKHQPIHSQPLRISSEAASSRESHFPYSDTTVPPLSHPMCSLGSLWPKIQPPNPHETRIIRGRSSFVRLSLMNPSVRIPWSLAPLSALIAKRPSICTHLRHLRTLSFVPFASPIAPARAGAASALNLRIDLNVR
jgi:hypothetical protein